MTDVLLIDQDSLFQQAFAKMIDGNRSCRLVGVAENEVEAKEYFSNWHPNIVFCDVMLGLENGLKLCQKIKKQFPETLCFILSNYCDVNLIYSAMKSGIEEYLLKPISRSKLSGIISDYTSRSTVARVNPRYEYLCNTIEERNYKKSYDACWDLAQWLFDHMDKTERQKQLIEFMTGLFFMIPGMDGVQKSYFQKKYELNNRIISKQVLCYHWLVEIVTEVYSQICTTRYVYMKKIFKYIEENKNNEISLADLSRQAGISSGYLSRIFKKYYNISVVDYMHLRKLLQAKYYMTVSEMNISDISFLLGYSEAGYFCKIFKKYEGITPSTFHKTAKN